MGNWMIKPTSTSAALVSGELIDMIVYCVGTYSHILTLNNTQRTKWKTHAVALKVIVMPKQVIVGAEMHQKYRG